MTPYIRIVDAEGNSYSFPFGFWLADDGWKESANMVNIPYAPGGVDIGDDEMEARTLTITGTIRADSLAALETAIRAWQRAVQKGGKIYVSDDVRGRYITVSGAMVDSTFQGEYRYSKKCSVSFNVAFPFWEDDTESTKTETLAGDTTFNVDNADSDYYVFPVIKIEANRGADVPTITIINLSDSGMRMEYSDPNFKIGDVVEIDCKEGTVKRNGNDAMTFFVQPRFLRLQNMINQILCEGATADVTFTWRKVTI